MKALSLIIGLIIVTSGYSQQTATNCGNYTSVGSTTWPTTFPDPDPGCAANVPGTVLAGPTQWDGGSCTGTIVTTVTGPPVTCLTVSYEAVNQNDFATLSTDTGGILTITGTGNCGINGTVIGPYTCSGGYGSCQFTICSTIPFSALTLLNTGCSSGWVINCAGITACTAPDINPLANFVGCDSYTLPPITGTNLSGNEAYWTGTGGTGTQYLPGDVITTSMTLFIYDETTLPCMDEETFTITLDVTDPVINCPGPLTAVCSIAEQPPYATLADFTTAGGTATDETSLDVASFTLLSEVSDGNTCPEVVTRTYQIADDCGHTSTCTQTITINDIVPPVFSAPPANVTVQCPADVPGMTTLGWTDNCDGSGVVGATDVSDNNTCPETITRTWTYTDACGNNASTSQTITVHDTQAPVLDPPPADITVECVGDVPAMVNLNYTDNCDAPGSVPGADGPLNGGPCGGTIIRTWTYTDACGNSSSVTQTITIDDTTPPTASNPPNITTSGAPPPPDPLVVTDETDNCGPPTVAWVSDVSDNQSCPETITRTYSVTDACGNSITVVQLIIIGDPFPPTGTAPADITVECIGDVPPADPLLIIDEADNNGVPTVTHASDVSDGNTCPEIITRTYAIEDICGNITNVTQLITIIDTQVPVFAAPPANVTVECIGDVPAMTNLNWTDNCDGAGSVTGNDVSDNNTCPETITRTWTYTDACGNNAIVTQTIIVDDTTPPTGTAPANVTVECIGDVPLPNALLITDEADNCTANPTVIHVSDVSDMNTCPETITRTYSITDDCGNVTNVIQTIIVDDTTLPTASNPAQTVIPGGPPPAPDVNLVIDEADNCTANPVVAFVSQASDNNPCPETITYTYSVTDDCGNSINVTHEVLITDPIMPTGTAPAAVVVECIGQVPAPDPLLITDEADNNGVPTVTWVSDVSDNNTCPETITRTYSIMDVCGNEVFVTHLITVNDITPPTASNPVAVNVECIGDVPLPDINVVTDEADNCTVSPVVAWVSDASDNNTCPETITRTYSVTDDCGNAITVTQAIVVDDITPPTASNPASVAVECIQDIPVADITVVTDEADNCSANPVVVHLGDASDGNSCPETITRTYSVTDDCGNTINVIQTIIINDITPPTASDPIPMNVSCATDVPAPDITVVTDEADNCMNNPIVAWVSDVSDNNVCNNETITRTYSVSDGCGNMITVNQQIVINAFIPSISAGLDQSICEGEQSILVATNPDGAAISWDNMVIDGVAFTPPLGTNTYTVTADICNGECLYADQVDVVVNPMPVVNFSGDILQGCRSHTVNFTNQSTEQFDCVWQFGDGNQQTNCGPVSNTYTSAGLFDVTLTITSAAGCMSTDSYVNYIEVIEMPDAEFTSSATLIDVNDPMVEFTNESTNATSYLWTFGHNTGSSSETDPTHFFPDLGEGQYNVQLIAYNSLGCPDTTNELIIVEDVLLFYVPNIFTPDGDLYNETFLPVFTSGFDIYDYHLTIFNRWGEIVFESYNALSGWNGHYGDGGLVQDGVYVWQIEFGETGTDKKQKVRGHVTVLK